MITALTSLLYGFCSMAHVLFIPVFPSFEHGYHLAIYNSFQIFYLILTIMWVKSFF